MVADISNGWLKRVWRAIVKGMIGGALVTCALATTMFLALVAPMLAQRRPPTAAEWRTACYKVVDASPITLTAGMLSGLLYGVSSRPRRLSGKRQTPVPQTQRPFSQRLGQFLGEERSTEPIEPAPRSRMAFFSAVVPGRRYRPKPASYIRGILWRIRRLLGGGS